MRQEPRVASTDIQQILHHDVNERQVAQNPLSGGTLDIIVIIPLNVFGHITDKVYEFVIVLGYGGQDLVSSRRNKILLFILNGF